MSKREAETMTESAAAKQRPVRNLSADVEVDNKADYVCQIGKNHPRLTRLGLTPCDNKRSRQAQAWRKQSFVDSEACRTCNSQKFRKRVSSNANVEKRPFRSGTTECGGCIKVTLTSSSTCLSMLRRWYNMVTLTWLKQRASVMRSTADLN